MAKFHRRNFEIGWDYLDLNVGPETPLNPEEKFRVKYADGVKTKVRDLFGPALFVSNVKDLKAPSVCNAKTEIDLDINQFLASRLKTVGPLNDDDLHEALSAILDDVVAVEMLQSGTGECFMLNPLYPPANLQDTELIVHPQTLKKKSKSKVDTFKSSILNYPSPSQWIERNNTTGQQKIVEIAPKGMFPEGRFVDTEAKRIKYEEVLSKSWIVDKDNCATIYKRHIVKEEGRETRYLWYKLRMKIGGRHTHPPNLSGVPVNIKSFYGAVVWLVRYYRLLNLIGTVSHLATIPTGYRQHDALVVPKWFATMPVTIPDPNNQLLIKSINPSQLEAVAVAARSEVKDPPVKVSSAHYFVNKPEFKTWQIRFVRGPFLKKNVAKKYPNPYTSWYSPSVLTNTSVQYDCIQEAKLQDISIPPDRWAENYHMEYLLKDIAETHEAFLRILEETLPIESQQEQEIEESQEVEVEEEPILIDMVSQEVDVEEEPILLEDIIVNEVLMVSQEELERTALTLTPLDSMYVVEPPVYTMQIQCMAVMYKDLVMTFYMALVYANQPGSVWDRNNRAYYLRALVLLMSITQEERVRFIEATTKMRNNTCVTLDLIPESWRKDSLSAAVYDAARLALLRVKGENIESYKSTNLYYPTSFMSPDTGSTMLARIVWVEDELKVEQQFDPPYEDEMMRMCALKFPEKITTTMINGLLKNLLFMDRRGEQFKNTLEINTRRRDSFRDLIVPPPSEVPPEIETMNIGVLEMNEWKPHENPIEFIFKIIPELNKRRIPPTTMQGKPQTTNTPLPSFVSTFIEKPLNPIAGPSGEQSASIRPKKRVVEAARSREEEMARLEQESTARRQATEKNKARRVAEQQRELEKENTAAASQNAETSENSLPRPQLSQSLLQEEEDSLDFTRIFDKRFRYELIAAERGWGSNMNMRNKTFFQNIVYPAVNEYVASRQTTQKQKEEDRDIIVKRSRNLEGLLQMEKRWEKESEQRGTVWNLSLTVLEVAMGATGGTLPEKSRLISRILRSFVKPPTDEVPPPTTYPTSGEVSTDEPLFREYPLEHLPKVDEIVATTARFRQNPVMFNTIKLFLQKFWKPALKNNPAMYGYMQEHNLYLVDWYMINDSRGFFMDALDYSELTPRSTVKVYPLALMTKNFFKILRYYRDPVEEAAVRIKTMYDKEESNDSPPSTSQLPLEFEEFDTQFFI